MRSFGRAMSARAMASICAVHELAKVVEHPEPLGQAHQEDRPQEGAGDAAEPAEDGIGHRGDGERQGDHLVVDVRRGVEPPGGHSWSEPSPLSLACLGRSC